MVGYCAFGLSRNEEVYGADANVFRPERWLEGSAEEMRVKEAALDLVFGHGRWQCLGKNIAYMELNKIFFEVSRPRPLLVSFRKVFNVYSSCATLISRLRIQPRCGTRRARASSCRITFGS